MDTGATPGTGGLDPRLRGLALHAQELCNSAAASLEESGVPAEALAKLVPARRMLGLFRRSTTMLKLGEAWRLGVFLLRNTEHGVSLYAQGRSTRAAERGRPGYQSQSLEERRDIAAAALRGGYAPGTAVHFDAQELPLDPDSLRRLEETSPLGLVEDAATGELELRVRWAPGTSLEHAPSFERYLTERVGLLVDPPPTST